MRARLFLLKHLHDLKQGPFWTPKFVILPELLRSMLPGRVGSEPELLMQLYDCYIRQVGGKDDISAFLGWAGTAMHDFSDVDAALADGRSLYSDLRNIREVEQWGLKDWSFLRNPLSDTQERFLLFWNELGQLYRAFKESQNQSRCWTYSSAARFLAENPQEMQVPKDSEVYFFLGIAGYSKAERVWIDNLSKRVDVRMVWDLDRYYYSNELHEAGEFARNHGVGIEKDNLAELLSSKVLNVKIYAANTAVSQIMRASEVLGEMSAQELQRTCVVLNEESSLEPLVASLTNIKAPVNLALGKPLHQTDLSRLFEQVLVLRNAMDNKGSVYFKTFKVFLRLLRSAGADIAACDSVGEELVKLHLVRIEQNDFRRWQETHRSLKVYFALLDQNLKPSEIVQQLLAICSELHTADDFRLVTQRKLAEMLEELHDLMHEFTVLDDYKVMLQLYRLLITSTKIYYRGEPVEGLQILSISETLALDFDTIFFLDANDEFMPGGGFEQSFIPFDLRSFHKLTMPADRDALHAYTFYRLLHRCSNVHFFYSSITSEKKGSEESRYIMQLRDELRLVNPNVTIREESIGTAEMMVGSEYVESTPFVRQRIQAFFERGISPSAINKFLACPLDFYYRYVAGLDEEEEVEEFISNSTFGRLVHNVLERFYDAYRNSFPRDEDYHALENRLYDELKIALSEVYTARNVSHGFNYLSMEVATEMLKRFITKERDLLRYETENGIPHRLISVEEKKAKFLAAEDNPLGFPILINGVIDRTDEVAGRLRLIDYKTGKVAQSGVFKGPMDALFKGGRDDKILQLFLYVMMLREPGKPLPTAEFYSFRDDGGRYVKLEDLCGFPIDHQAIDEFEEGLKNCLSELYHTERFEHNSKSIFCNYCLGLKEK